MRCLTLTLTLALLPVIGVAGQHAAAPGDSDTGPVIHGRTFSTGTREGWTFSTSHLDIDGGLYRVGSGGANVSKAFFRLHVQTALGIHLVQVSSDLQWIPSFGATPVWSGTLELAPIHQESPFYVAGGIGLVTGHDFGLDKLVGWAQGTVAARTPIHELTPFVQVGRALVTGNHTEFLIGIAHPLAPYKLHFP
ncbi:MAG TPA: hypothetical protein VFP39_05560 [Gemmatimonadales bacterium]|nr:hypothetical protein [Gemmatimonadales bacterium]